MQFGCPKQLTQSVFHAETHDRYQPCALPMTASWQLELPSLLVLQRLDGK